ncbi:hypothetical protein EVAR_10568_1 [Eumeta japonica]|uniref:Uncharacterized protein n=1 Tax=Eumeta variegata TaxID=151549 RepID=A0A4C1U2D5_EUMVA|nr:hypothetical protein EVAR_10568_1 [Eumeta japonica]
MEIASRASNIKRLRSRCGTEPSSQLISRVKSKKGPDEVAHKWADRDRAKVRRQVDELDVILSVPLLLRPLTYYTLLNITQKQSF